MNSLFRNSPHRGCSRPVSPAPTRVRVVFAVVFAVALVCSVGACRSGEDVDFNAEIRPILNEKCVACHGGVRRKADLSLLFRDDALRPAESGRPAIVPGDPGASELMRRVQDHNPDDRMPKEAPPLSDVEIGKIRAWIAGGAEWQPHWAYVPPVQPPVPEAGRTGWGQNPIDAFVLARLDENGLEPSAPAPCQVLVRRVALDLTGLPPRPGDVMDVCGTTSAPRAGSGEVQSAESVDEARYARFIDELLGRPQFGERWAAMWLDLARYADSQGYEKDGPRSIWRYRDYVIDAFNRDLPFDAFTIEQLAGDLLPQPTVEQRIATAFHRNTMTNTEGGTDDEEHRVAAVIDRVNTTFEVWQSTSAGCAQCHGHPYDPLRHEEYYRLFAFFNNTKDWDQDGDGPVEREFDAADAATGKQLLADLETVSAEMNARASSPEVLAAHAKWETELDDPGVVGAVRNTWQNELLRVVKIPDADRTPAQRTYSTKMFVETRPEFEDLREQRRTIGQELAKLEATTTPVMQELPPDERRETHVFERGNFLLPTARVTPDVPAFLPALSSTEGSTDTLRMDAPANSRLDLARWLVSQENPLTARVVVNRFWEQLFGFGIVETLEDFGTQGERPTHPELLDWLAVEFRDEMSWSVKTLLRQIVLSQTYRQSSRMTPDIFERDPANRLLARGPRFRLSAEQVRDQALAVSGLLSDEMFGPSVMPPQPDGIWQNPYSNMRWETAQGEDRYRRALYTYWRRTAPYPSMITFDSPSREFCVSRRVRTNTPLQALVTLNDPVYVEAAAALADRMLETGNRDPASLVNTGYAMAMGYLPVAAKSEALVSLYNDVLREFEDDDGGSVATSTRRVSFDEDDPHRRALIVVANAIMNTDEFLTKE